MPSKPRFLGVLRKKHSILARPVCLDSLAAVPALPGSGKPLQRAALSAPVCLDSLAAVPAPPGSGGLCPEEAWPVCLGLRRLFPVLWQSHGLFQRQLGGLGCFDGRPGGRSRSSAEWRVCPEGWLQPGSFCFCSVFCHGFRCRWGFLVCRSGLGCSRASGERRGFPEGELSCERKNGGESRI